MAIHREAVVASAEKLVARGRIDGAIKEYRKLVADNPGDAMTINRLGDLYVRVNKIEEAVGLFGQIAERYTQDGFFVKAIAIYKKIIKLDPTRLPVYERLAELYHKQGLVSEARTQYQVLVDYYLKHGKPDSAENVLRQMTALDSGDPSPHVKLAEIYRERGDHEREFSEYRRLAEMMLRHNRVDEAGQVYARAVALAPTDLGFITDAVLGLKDAGHPGAAAKLLALAVEKNPQAAKIARLAGLEKDRRGDLAGSHPRPGDEPRVLKVSDIAAAPPELRVAPPRTGITSTGSATSRPRVEPPPPSGEILTPLPAEFETPARPATEAEDARASAPLDSGSAFDSGEEIEIEFELEIEGVETEAAPPSARPSVTPAASAEPAEGVEIDWSFAPEPSLDLDLELPEVAPPSRAPEPVAPAEAFAVEPVPAPAVQAPSPAKRLGDLLAEAEVFRKYGLGEKAHDRVREILRDDPRHADAIGLSALLYLDAGRFDRALTRGQELERLAAEMPSAVETWSSVRARLEKAGFKFSDGRLAAAPILARPKRDSMSALLDELAGVRPASKPAPAKPAAPDLNALVDGLVDKSKPRIERRLAPPVESPPDLVPRPAPAPPVAPPPAALPPPVAPTAEAAPPFAEEPLEALDEAIDSRLAWLDEAAARAKSPAAPSVPSAAADGDALFDEEEGFFDLAAELEEELTQVEIATGQQMLPREEPTLEEIVEGFKKGVADSLSPEDYDTHFNLGIAYREMGLLDEAIGEFQLAAKHPNYLLDCCSLLGGCFLEKGLPELAVRWYQKGLATPDLSEDGRLGLLYDMGNLFVATGDEESARRTFVEIYGINSNYRDIVALLEELGAR